MPYYTNENGNAVYIDNHTPFYVGDSYYSDWADYERTVALGGMYAALWAAANPASDQRSIVIDPWMRDGAYTPTPPTGGSNPVPSAAIPVPVLTTPSKYEVPSSARDANLFAEVVEGISVRSGDPAIYSTGKRRFTTIEGWDAAGQAIAVDGVAARTPNKGAVRCDTLVAKGPQLNIPDGATVTGIKIHVTRRVV